MILSRVAFVFIAAAALGACATPAPGDEVKPQRPVPDQGGLLSTRIQGHWQGKGDETCATGPMVALDGPRIVITHRGKRTVHEIASDAALELHTRVLEPAAEAGAAFTFLPEFNATSAARSFNLIVQNTATGAKENWAPCEAG